MRLGDIELDVLSDGTFRLDGGAMFGVVPKPLWEPKASADERNRILLGLNCLLLRGRGRTIIAETGIGARWSAKYAEIYDIRRDGGLPARLAERGVRPEEVTDVVLTHLHFDHAGGAVVEDGGVLRPTFPEATYHVQADMWEWARNPSPRDRGSFRPDDFACLADGDLKLHEGRSRLDDGLALLPTYGHTVGLHVLRVRTDEGTVLFPTDVVPTSAHLRLPWVMAYDLFPLTTVKEKAEILGSAADDGWLVVLGHDAACPCVRIRREGEGFAVAEAVACGPG